MDERNAGMDFLLFRFLFLNFKSFEWTLFDVLNNEYAVARDSEYSINYYRRKTENYIVSHNFSSLFLVYNYYTIGRSSGSQWV